MISATRLNGERLWINPDNIELVATTPDTMITLTNGKKFMVRESTEAIRRAFLEYQRIIHMPVDAKVMDSFKHLKNPDAGTE
jgi:flagellar protein FlbD